MKIYHIFKFGYDGKWGSTYATTERLARVQFAILKTAVHKEALEMLNISEEEYDASDLVYSSRYADQIKAERADIETLKSLTFDNCKDRAKQPKLIEMLKWEIIDVLEEQT